MSRTSAGASLYEGQSVWVRHLGDGLAELCFDRQGESVNKFDQRTTTELMEAVARIAATPEVRGLLCTSAKGVFVVGADINEFGARFQLPEAALALDVQGCNVPFVALEDLRIPTVAAINGYALGGGLEFALACALRVMSSAAQVGLPEVKLGLFPALGGTVRLPRVAGTATAIEWITSGEPRDAAAALAARAVDAVCAPEALRETALGCLRQAVRGDIAWADRQRAKCSPLAEDAALRQRLYDAACAQLEPMARHQPAALAAVELMARCAPLERQAALVEESVSFARIAKTQAAAALVQTFLSDQRVRKLARQRGDAVAAGRERLVGRARAAFEGAARRLLAEGAAPAQIDGALQEFGWSDVPWREQHAADGGRAAPAFSSREIGERPLLALTVEAARALDDAVVSTPAEADIALLQGLGVPPHIGGALQWADWVGLPEVLRRC
ncbi:MAG TPA: enoyl-CoA hydratase-related protein, partial [Ramlibacter sp.]|nr:enoyl-CoA hydratase-related protein [Ramlibacter sp.]